EPSRLSLACYGSAGRTRPGRRVQHALGGAAPIDPRFDRGPGRQDHRRDHYHCHRPDTRLRRYERRLPASPADRLPYFDRVRGVELLPDLLPVRRRGAGLMAEIVRGEPVRGYFAPVHRALVEPILLGGAPRAVAILNGTLAAALALGLRLWVLGILFWILSHA